MNATSHHEKLLSLLLQIRDYEVDDPWDIPEARRDRNSAANVCVPVEGEIIRAWPGELTDVLSELIKTADGRSRILIYFNQSKINGVGLLKCRVLLIRIKIYARYLSWLRQYRYRRFTKGSPSLDGHEERVKLLTRIYREFCQNYLGYFTAQEITERLYPGGWKFERFAGSYVSRVEIVLKSLVLDGDLAMRDDEHYEVTPQIIRTIERHRAERRSTYMQICSLATAIFSAIATCAGVVVAYITFFSSKIS